MEQFVILLLVFDSLTAEIPCYTSHIEMSKEIVVNFSDGSWFNNVYLRLWLAQLNFRAVVLLHTPCMHRRSKRNEKCSLQFEFYFSLWMRQRWVRIRSMRECVAGEKKWYRKRNSLKIKRHCNTCVNFIFLLWNDAIALRIYLCVRVSARVWVCILYISLKFIVFMCVCVCSSWLYFSGHWPRMIISTLTPLVYYSLLHATIESK